jgi:hypothetical protein
MYPIERRALTGHAAVREAGVPVSVRWATAGDLAAINLERRSTTDNGGKSIECS